MPGTASRSPARTSPGRYSSLTTMSPLSQCLPTTRDRTGRYAGRARGQRAGVVGVVERGPHVVAHAAVDGDVGAGQAAVQLDHLHGADLVERERGRAGDRPAGLDRDPRHGDAEGRALADDDLGQPGGQLGAAASGRAGSCRRRRSLRRGRARAARGPARRDSWACRAMIRCAATSKPEVSKIWLPMWRVQPAQVQPSLVLQDEVDRLGGLPAGQRQPELLVLVGGRDVLVGVGLDADRDAAAAPAPDGRAGAPPRPPGRSRRCRRRRPGRCRPRLLGRSRRRSCCCRASRFAPAAPPPAGPRPVRRRCRCRPTARPRPSSARPRCTGTPCPRSRRRRCRRTPT